MSSAPKISVVLPVFNAAPYLRETLDSIFGQTFNDFEVLAIDDGSSDGSAEVLASHKDSRLIVLLHESNLGLVTTLNEGLAMARGEYVARMDADDICLPARFAKQVEFLEANPEVGMCGTRARQFGADSRLMAPPSAPARIRCELLFGSAFVHPSVMMRKSAFQSNDLAYRRSAHTEDIELWQRAADCFPIANLPEVLLKYRVHSGSITGSATYAKESASALRPIHRRVLQRLGIEPSERELDLHNLLRSSTGAPLEEFEQWLTKLKDANHKVNFYPRTELDQAIARRWFRLCHLEHGFGALKWSRMRSSKLSDDLQASAVEIAKFALRYR